MKNLKTKENHLRVIRLLQLVEEVNHSIAISVKNESTFEKKQYLHLKSKYVKDLAELLKTYDLSIEIKNIA